MAAHGGPDLDSEILLHTAQVNLNGKFSQLFESFLSTIPSWATFIQWGSHTQDVIDSQKSQKSEEDTTIAIVVVGWGIGLTNALKGRTLVSLNQIDLQVLELRAELLQLRHLLIIM